MFVSGLCCDILDHFISFVTKDFVSAVLIYQYLSDHFSILRFEILLDYIDLKEDLHTWNVCALALLGFINQTFTKYSVSKQNL